ncbi:MAG TPA: glycosyltransferase family 4 protein [Blastocatellia bacterium]|nr:glycosyltransferase family 4 protein [Blastocatellia bacterium]
MLAVIETHPIQYHAPVYRALQSKYGVPTTAIYGSDFSVVGYRDREFGADLAWDTDLLSGYDQVFLSQVEHGGARNFEEVSANGLNDALSKVAPKMVLMVGYSPRFNQSAFYEVWKAGYPMLFRAETTDHALNRNTVKTFMRDAFLRLWYRRSSKLLYIGRHSYQHYKRLKCPDEKLVFSPYCVDVSTFETDENARARMRPELRRSLNLGEEQIVLLFSGKLSHRKGPDLILRAVKQLPPEVREKINVVFLGSGQLKDELESLAQESPRVKAFFPGFQNQSRLSRFYHAADLLILPSREGETWGLVVNEALHHGLPCVVSEAVGCAPDIVENDVTGRVFETGSYQSLASALIQALKLVGRDEARRNCRQKVSGYSVESAAEGIAEAYWQVAGDVTGQRKAARGV